MKYSFISLIIGLILVTGAFLLLQRGNVSPFKVDQLQALINESQIGENDYEVFDNKINELIANGQIELYLESSSVVILLITVALGFALTFFGIHTIIDKLFFKKFFEHANFQVGIRRSLLFTGVIIAAIILRFYRVEWNMVILLIPLFIVVELIIVYFSADKSEDKQGAIDRTQIVRPVFVNTTAQDGHISGEEFFKPSSKVEDSKIEGSDEEDGENIEESESLEEVDEVEHTTG